MKILRFSIENYKSYRLPSTIPLAPGFNVIVGQNNAGKSALLDALSLRFSSAPHRSVTTIPEYGENPPSKTSTATVWLELGKEELLRELWRSGQREIRVPVSRAGIGIDPVREASGETRVNPSPDFREIVQYGVVLQLAYASSTPQEVATFLSSQSQIMGYTWPKLDGALHYRLGDDGSLGRPRIVSGFSEWDGTPQAVIGPLLVHRIYRFHAERPMGRFQEGSGTARLEADASNLPYVLDDLKRRDPHRFSNFEKLVGNILPDVRQVTIYGQIRPILPQSESLHIRIWTDEEALGRDDLFIPLADSGSGVGQVLAMLYVLITARTSQIIVIDEPQSFLHPGAVRRLFDILRREFPQHQYIVTTHSPDVIAAADAEEIIRVYKDGAESRVEVLDSSKLETSQLVLADLGTRLADVFGADNILWVEGATEEICFPLILQQAKSERIGTIIRPVVQTGDFDSKHSETILRVYDQLSSGTGVLPPAIGFVFDREKRDDRERERLRRLGRDRVFFLERLMYENYLLDAGTVARLINDEMGAVAREPEEDQFEQISAAQVEAIFAEDRGERSELEWLINAHGAKLLAAACSRLTGKRLTYDKKRHGRMLTGWLLKSDAGRFDEVVQVLNNALRQ